MGGAAGGELARSLSIGALGGLLFQLTGLPLAWMLGPLVANLLVSALDIDPVFVAFHHLLRMVALMVFAPFWACWLLSRR